LRIAFISYEYPPDTAVGGIATYTRQAATLLARRGHDVEVFAGSETREGEFVDDGVLVHRINVGDNRSQFRQRAGVAFQRRYSDHPFDVLEGPDFTAEADAAIRLVPQVPFVVKLHMGLFTILSIEASLLGPVKRARMRLGALRRFDRTIWDPRQQINIAERNHARRADEIVAPSSAIAKWMQRAWALSPDRISVIPNPFVPDPRLLSIPVETDNRSILFLGRLELRKGVVTLADALPHVLRQLHGWKARFIGRSLPSPHAGTDMRAYLRARTGDVADRVEFVDHISPARIPQAFAQSDICVFPSVWENFPNVCLEAMAAGRAIVASSAGGMPEQLDHGSAGRLVTPRNPRLLAKSLIDLARSPQTRHAYGHKARERVVSAYSESRIGPMLEASYWRAIAQFHLTRPITPHPPLPPRPPSPAAPAVTKPQVP
jgi:glycosyltransferase involved in cell wall biosynthesis